MTAKKHIGIVGAGIGGLTLALALRQRGLDAVVFERASELREIGAAIALMANGVRELERLGCLDRIAAVSAEPSEFIWRGWRSDERIASFPVALGGAYRARFGAPYFGTHRADLQRVLADAFGTSGLRLGHQLVTINEHDGKVRLDFANSESAEVDVLVGADGSHSFVREYVSGERQGAVYSGTSGFRGIVPVGDLPSLPDPQAVQFWMGPNAHLLHFAIGPSGSDINFLAVVEGPRTWNAESWVEPVAHEDAVAAFEGWHPAVVEMVGAVSHKLRWALFQVRPLSSWQRGRVVLMGDAAHGMLPHHGQGANTTIEDAITLAELLHKSSLGDFDHTIKQYQRLRRARTRLVQRSAHDTNRVLHLPDDKIEKRTAYLARVPERFGWLHGFDALGDVTAWQASGRFPTSARRVSQLAVT